MTFRPRLHRITGGGSRAENSVRRSSRASNACDSTTINNHPVATWLFDLTRTSFALDSLESPSPSDIRVSASGLSDGSSVSAALSMASAGGLSAPWDSDIEADPDPPDWTRNLDPDVVEKMSPKEKQRQEVVNGTPTSYFYSAFGLFT